MACWSWKTARPANQLALSAEPPSRCSKASTKPTTLAKFVFPGARAGGWSLPRYVQGALGARRSRRRSFLVSRRTPFGGISIGSTATSTGEALALDLLGIGPRGNLSLHRDLCPCANRSIAPSRRTRAAERSLRRSPGKPTTAKSGSALQMKSSWSSVLSWKGSTRAGCQAERN